MSFVGRIEEGGIEEDFIVEVGEHAVPPLKDVVTFRHLVDDPDPKQQSQNCEDQPFGVVHC